MVLTLEGLQPQRRSDLGRQQAAARTRTLDRTLRRLGFTPALATPRFAGARPPRVLSRHEDSAHEWQPL